MKLKECMSFCQHSLVDAWLMFYAAYYQTAGASFSVRAPPSFHGKHDIVFMLKRRCYCTESCLPLLQTELDEEETNF